MSVADYCGAEPGFVLLPLEFLGRQGLKRPLADFLRSERDWPQQRLDLLERSLALYLRRSGEIAARNKDWPVPRVRNIGVVESHAALRPYAQVLNTSTWTLYLDDLDVDHSCEAFVAYLLVLGDWMGMTGEVTQAAMRSAAWWLTCDDAERAAFSRSAARSRRPDAAALRAVASALSWLIDIRHAELCPATEASGHLEIPGTGLQVPRSLERRPLELIEACRAAAVSAVEAYRAAWRSSANAEVAELAEWLVEQRPRVLVTRQKSVVWTRVDAESTRELEGLLERADGVAVEAIRLDLAVVHERSERFLSALNCPDELPDAGHDLSEGGYAYMYAGRKIIAYDLEEPGMERLHGVPLPYERAMLGARTLHEWAHLADEAGCVALAVDREELTRRSAELAAIMQQVVEQADPGVQKRTKADLAGICAGRPAGEALVEMLLARLPDHRANRIASAFMDESERGSYLRHNIRTLRYEFSPDKLWRMLARYLYEYQYLLPGAGLACVEDPYSFMEKSTGLDFDLVATGVIDRDGFEAGADALGRVFACYEIDPEKIRLPGERGMNSW